MSTAAKLRRHAADCFRLAQSVSAPKDRAVLTEMAAIWLRLADRSEIVRGAILGNDQSVAPESEPDKDGI
jgi:hypothetical protein